MHTSAPQKLSDSVSASIDSDSDYLTQCHHVLKAIQKLGDDGDMRMWPNPIANLPIPKADALRGTLDSFLPEGHAAVLALFDQGQLYTAIAILRGGDALERVVGAETIAGWVGPLGGDWTRDHRVVCDAVSINLGPVHVGLFAEAHTCRQLLRDPRPGAWAAATATREVIVHPMPLSAALTLGIDGFAGVFRSAARALSDVDLSNVGQGPPLPQPVEQFVQWINLESLQVIVDALKERRSSPPPSPDSDDDDDDMGFGPLI